MFIVWSVRSQPETEISFNEFDNLIVVFEYFNFGNFVQTKFHFKYVCYKNWSVFIVSTTVLQQHM